METDYQVLLDIVGTDTAESSEKGSEKKPVVYTKDNPQPLADFIKSI